MKYILFFVAMTFCKYVLAFECGHYDKYSQPVSTHMELATDIFWGQVVAGEYDQVSGVAKFVIDVNGVLKGKMRHSIELDTLAMSYGVSVTLGENNIYFLYDESKNINSCAMIIRIGDRVASIEQLKEKSDRADLADAHRIRELLQSLGKMA